MTFRRSMVLGPLLIIALGACGSGGGDNAGGSGTELEVEGVVTTSLPSVTPAPGEPAPPIPEPGEASEVAISGTLTCNGATPTGTGMFAANAEQVCLEVAGKLATFDAIANPGDIACAEMYGGPQHASISGSIDGHPVDVSINRSDGCGIENWTRLDWLLGPPER